LSSSAILSASKAQDLLPSWNDGAAKQAIVDFFKATAESGGTNFVAPARSGEPLPENVF
jgi:hypothetical protein